MLTWRRWCRSSPGPPRTARDETLLLGSSMQVVLREALVAERPGPSLGKELTSSDNKKGLHTLQEERGAAITAVTPRFHSHMIFAAGSLRQQTLRPDCGVQGQVKRLFPSSCHPQLPCLVQCKPRQVPVCDRIPVYLSCRPLNIVNVPCVQRCKILS